MRGGKRLNRRRWRDANRHQFRRDGFIALGLFVLPWVAALVLWRSHYHVDVAGVIIPVSFGFLAAWLAWATYRGPKRSGTRVSTPSLAQVADQLAVAVGKQWADEAAIRRLNDPYPLPVSWCAADASLTDSWDSLVKLASSGAGWPPPPSAGTWAVGPDDLAGEGGELVQVLGKVPTGRLVVLGEPGAGKTMLMVRLVLDLLARRASGDTIPFLVSIASWNPAEQDLQGWLEGQLLIDYPALASPGPTDHTEPTQAASLLTAGLILPILDGLDEIPNSVRGRAINRISDALRPGEQVVLTCRTGQYRDAVRPQSGAEATLRAAAIQLCPLDAKAVRGYLCDVSAGPVARARWNPVLAVLDTEAPAGQALSTPLMVSLARTIYNPRPGELSGPSPDPKELCDLADRTEVESRLFDAFIPAVYRHDPARRWNAQDAEEWLVFLARHLESIFSFDLSWWQVSRRLIFFRPEAVAWRLAETATMMVVPLVAPILQIATGWTPLPVLASSRISSAASPKASLALARRTAIVTGSLVGIAFGDVLGVVFGVMFGVVFGVVAGIVGGVAFGVGAVRVRSFTALWLRYEIARTLLALRRQLPWQFMSFLADAHQRGILRQAGAVYQFRHVELQHRLARRQ